MNHSTIAILGAGSWGTAMAIHLAQSGHRVLLWSHNADALEKMQHSRSNERYLPGIHFLDNLILEKSIEKCVVESDECIIAVPSHAFKEVLVSMPKPQSGLSWLTKGVDPTTQSLLSELVSELWGSDYPYGIISGPSFAKEVAQDLPTAIVIAGNHQGYISKMQSYLHDGNLRVYLCPDPIGVQLCGAVKNVLAIACGISDGMNFGANAKAALITRGLTEMSRLGQVMGAKPETFIGLAGVGDLVLTCTDDQSRNRRFGLQLGKGVEMMHAEQSIGQVVEGKHNASQVMQLAIRHQIDMPICKEVDAILREIITPKQAVGDLMRRPPKVE